MRYENVEYRVLINNKILIACRVNIIEDGTNYIDSKVESEGIHDPGESLIKSHTENGNEMLNLNDENVNLGFTEI